MFTPGQSIEGEHSQHVWQPAEYVTKLESEVTKNGLVKWHLIRWAHNGKPARVQEWRIREKADDAAG